MAYKLKSVAKDELADLLADAPSRGRTSEGATLLEQFLGSGEAAARVDAGDAKKRNALAISVNTAVKRSGTQLWVRKVGGAAGTELLLINLSKADAATRKAYDNRPKVGRKPAQ